MEAPAALPPHPEPSGLAAASAKLLAPERRQVLLVQALAEAEKRVQADPTEAHLRALKAAEADLRAAMAAAAPAAEPAPAPAAPEADFTGTGAVAYLRDQGFKVEKSKFYEDAASGKIGKNKAGRYTETALQAYGRAHCKPLAGVVSRDKRIDDLLERKLRAETERAEARAELDALRAKIENGEYVLAASRDQYLAQRLQRLKDDTKTAIHANASRKIELVGGDPARLPDLLAFELRLRAEWLGRYAEEARDRRPWLVPAVPAAEEGAP